jgi:hypothetical protein
MSNDASALVLFGDPVTHSDVGNFCQRLVASSNGLQIEHLSPSFRNLFSDSLTSFFLSGNGGICANIVNNKNIAFNHVAAVFAALRISQAGLSRPTLVGIVHDPSIRHVTGHLLQVYHQFSHGSLPPLSDSSSDDLLRYCSILLVNEVLPASDRRTFLSMDVVRQSEYLLGSILGYYDVVVCHSQAAKKLIRRSLDLVGCTKDIHVLPLPHDTPVSFPDAASPSEASLGTDSFVLQETVRIALYGLSVDTSVNIGLLLSFVEQLSRSCHVRLTVAGRNNEYALASLNELSILCDSVTVDDRGFVSESSLVEILSGVDYVWAYRDAASGESSGTVLRALSCGACPIVAGHGAYLELPPSLVAVYPPGLQSFDGIDIASLSHGSSLLQRSVRQEYIVKHHSPRSYVESILQVLSGSSPLSRVHGAPPLGGSRAKDLYEPIGNYLLGFRYSLPFEIQKQEVKIDADSCCAIANEFPGLVRRSLAHMPIPPDFLPYSCLSIFPIVVYPGCRDKLDGLLPSRLSLFVDIFADHLLTPNGMQVNFPEPMPHLSLRSQLNPYCFFDDASTFALQEFERSIRLLTQRVGDRREKLVIGLPVVFSMLFAEMLSPLVNLIMQGKLDDDSFDQWVRFSNCTSAKIEACSFLRDPHGGLGRYATDLLLRFYNWHSCLGFSLLGLR